MKGWIYANFGDYSTLAKHLAIDVSTVSHWSNSNPRNMLRFLPELCNLTKADANDILDAVVARENEIVEVD